MSQQIFLANDKYRAALRANWIDDPPDGSLLVSAVPDNVPTLVVVGWQTDFETVFSVQGKAGHDFETYALTGVSRLRGYDGVIPENTTVNCLNNEEFMNQYLTFLGIEWKGEWDAGVTYVANDGVSYDGSSYISKVADNTNHTVTDTDYWQLVTLRGASWSHGAGAPDNGNGMEGDFYLNTTNDDVYVKGASTWSLLVNIKGEQGIQGIQGIAATITVGTVTTGAPGSSVTITNVGDENDAVFDISIPEGQKGDTGDQGIQGVQGIQGEPGVSVIDSTSLKNTTLLEDTTNTDTYAGSFAVSPGSYFTGLKVNLKVTNANTGAATLNVNALGAKSIKKNVVDDVEADDIKAGQIIPLIYDGTNFQIVGGGGTGGGADVLSVQVFS